jgi:tRNA pseudouridine55 synthase
MEADLEVSSGTYIRALARDLGAAAGSGAHLVALRRVGSGDFNVGAAHSMESIALAAGERRLANLLLPLDAGLDGIPALEVATAALPLLADGATMNSAQLSPRPSGLLDGELVRLVADGELVALARATATGAQPERVFIDARSEGARSEAPLP